MNPPQSTQRSQKWLSVRLCAILFVIFCSLIALGYVSGGVRMVLHASLARAMANRDYENAEAKIAWIRKLGCDDGETAFWEARLDRKLLRIADVSKHLDRAHRAGFDPERIRREVILLQAQTGKIQLVVNQLNQMMIEPNGDGEEICEAYVNGALIAGVPSLALQILPVWKQEFPHDPQPHYAHARLLEYQERLDDAEAELRIALGKNRRHWPAIYALGRLLYSRNLMEQALQQFLLAAEMPNNSAALYQQARALLALGRTKEAQGILQRVVQRSPESIRSSFSRVGEPEYGLPVQLELGTLESSLENYPAANQWLTQVLEYDPNNLDARYARAIVLRELDQIEEAEKEFAEVQRVRTQLEEVDRLVDEINQNPEDLQLEKRCRVGELFLRHEDARRGEFWLKETLNLAPDYAPAHALLAEYYSELAQRYPEYASLAEEHHESAIKYSSSEHNKKIEVKPR